MSLTFKDNFSKQSDVYVKYRPLYPDELYSFLASLTSEHKTAWDCGTGNGQAAIGLADYYDQVIATDPSEQQIKNAFPHPRVQYLVEKSEDNSIQSDSIDIVTIANALHWFDLDLFYKEVNRVVKSGGIIAAWSYALFSVSPEIDDIIKRFNDEVIKKYWPPEVNFVKDRYKTIPFPFDLINGPEFICKKQMNLRDVIGYLNTWSATQRFINENKLNPTDKLYNELLAVWENPDDIKTINWKMTFKIGRIRK